MPRYDYKCPNCEAYFEADGRHDDRYMECGVCGSEAERRPFSGIPHLKGETVSKNIPDAAYRNDAARRELAQSWGTAERSMELIRAHRKEDSEGRKYVDTPAITRAS